MVEVIDLINKYGFPMVSALGVGYMIFYVWTWATKDIKPVLNEANATLLALIERVRVLDSDLIRLNQKISTAVHLRRRVLAHEKIKVEELLNSSDLSKKC